MNPAKSSICSIFVEELQEENKKMVTDDCDYCGIKVYWHNRRLYPAVQTAVPYLNTIAVETARAIFIPDTPVQVRRPNVAQERPVKYRPLQEEASEVGGEDTLSKSEVGGEDTLSKISDGDGDGNSTQEANGVGETSTVSETWDDCIKFVRSEYNLNANVVFVLDRDREPRRLTGLLLMCYLEDYWQLVKVDQALSDTKFRLTSVRRKCIWFEIELLPFTKYGRANRSFVLFEVPGSPGYILNKTKMHIA